MSAEPTDKIELRVESGADEPLARRFINSSLYFDIDPSVKTCGFATSPFRGGMKSVGFADTVTPLSTLHS